MCRVMSMARASRRRRSTGIASRRVAGMIHASSRAANAARTTAIQARNQVAANVACPRDRPERDNEPGSHNCEPTIEMSTPRLAARASDVPALEDLIPLSQVPARVEPILGKRIHRSTPHKWARTGVAGRRLRVVRLGSTVCTTAAWLSEFCAAIEEAMSVGAAAPEPQPKPRATRRTTRRRRPRSASTARGDSR